MGLTEATGVIPDATIASWRSHFPILLREINGHPLAYLDTAATAHRPVEVTETLSRFYKTHNANVHRGIHTLSREATELFEEARRVVARSVGAAREEEVVFTRGTTESMNLVAHGWARPRLGPGDEIVVTEMEHHANIVPWQLVAEQTGAVVRPAPITDDGRLDMEAFGELVGERTRIVSAAHASNVLGTINPIAEMAERAHAVGAVMVVDGAQGLAHGGVDVGALGADFYAFSAHKVYGPMGAGGLWGRYELLEQMSPFMGGGEMIEEVTWEGPTLKAPPSRFEPGTMNIAGAIAFAEALRFVEGLGREAIATHERSLLQAAIEGLGEVEGVRMYGTTRGPRCAIVPFNIEGVHAHDVGTVLDQAGIAIRTGRHCAYPLIARLGAPAVARASFGLYNTRGEVDRLVEAVRQCAEMFR
jgi:cysteine desulfurase/selenocysteine lyase